MDNRGTGRRALRRGAALGLALAAVWGVSLTADLDVLGARLVRLGQDPALAVSLAACFRPLPGAVPEAAAGPVMGRRSCRLPVHLWAAPPGAFVGSCLLSAGVLEPPAATDRPTENAGENAPDFPGLFAGPLPPPVQVQDAPRLHVSRRAGPDRHAGGRENFRRGILRARYSLLEDISIRPL